ncbi:hypothetical protein J5X91_17325 [Pseudoalteromonas sp. K222D]|uniref:hypothetical protein n=1 Tax=Pseudoalteromonas sp. K222D TaxID=2820756 RepID=UPI001AD7D2ED|nr:hypothetical protein [Pseudoalteromonas sp. K222D]MBO7928005.1 hypothetical protein [Pseudoalteromonas sp. K222D]
MSNVNLKIIEIKQKISDAKKLSPLQAGKKVALAEGAIDGAIEVICDIEYRLEQVEQILSLSNLEALINGGDDGY